MGCVRSLALPLALAAAVTPTGCNREGSDRTPAGAVAEGSVPARTVTAREPAPGLPVSATAPRRCLVPLPDEPAPRAAPATACPRDPTGPLPLRHGFVGFPEAPGRPRVEVEIADGEAARTRGLMYRTSMPDDRGMIFSWNFESRRSFWMRDTCLPLDMLFITKDGTIAGIVEQVPVLNDSPRSIACPVAHVLEVNAGWVRAHGVRPGQRVEIEN